MRRHTSVHLVGTVILVLAVCSVVTAAPSAGVEPSASVEPSTSAEPSANVETTPLLPGSWEGTIKNSSDPNLAGRRLSLELSVDCVDASGQVVCGTFAVRKQNGVGCVYDAMPDHPGQPPVGTYVFRLEDPSTWGCAREGGWSGMWLKIEPADDGRLAAGRCSEASGPCDVSFALYPVRAIYRPPEMKAKVDDTTVVPGQRVTLRASGYMPGSTISMWFIGNWNDFSTWTTGQAAGLANASGSLKARVRIPQSAALGRSWIGLSGLNFDSLGCEELCLAIPVTVVASPRVTSPPMR